MSDHTLPGEGAARHAPNMLCCGCGYDLAGLPETATCPECALPVATTLAVSLERQLPEALARIHASIWWIAATIVAAILSLLVTGTMEFAAVEAATNGDATAAAMWTAGAGVIGLVLAAMFLVGVLKLTTPLNPSNDPRFERPGVRKAVRVASLVAVLLVVQSVGAEVVMQAGHAQAMHSDSGDSPWYWRGFIATIAVGFLATINAGIIYLGSAAYVATLAARAGHLKLERRARLIVRVGLIAYALAVLTAGVGLVQTLFPDIAPPAGVMVFGMLALAVGAVVFVVSIGWLVMLSQTLQMVSRVRKKLRAQARPA